MTTLSQLTNQLSRLLADYRDEFTVVTDAELEAVQAATTNQVTGVNPLSSDLLNTVLAPESALAQTKFNSVLQSLFGTARLTPDFSSTSLTEGGNTAASVSPLSACDAASPGELLQQIGTFQVNRVSASLELAKASFSMLANNSESLRDAVNMQGGKALLVAIGLQQEIMAQVEDQINACNTLIGKMNEEDYQVDHRILINQAALHLVDAKSRFKGLASLAAAGAQITLVGSEAAREPLIKAEALLTGVKLKELLEGFPNKKTLELSGRIVLLETLQASLEAASIEYDEAKRTSLEDIDNPLRLFKLSEPVYKNITCRLEALLNDIAAAITANNVLVYLRKEREWGLELVLLIKLAELSDNLLVDLTEDLFNSSIKTVIDELVREDCPNIEFGDITRRLAEYIKALKHKLSYNVDPAAALALGQQTIAFMTQWSEQHQSFSQIFNEKTSGFAGRVRKGVKILKLFTSTLRGVQGAEKMVAALSKGNIKDFLTARSPIEEATSILSDIGDAIAGTVDRAEEVSAGTLDAVGVLENRTRAELLFNESLEGYTETYMRQVITADAPSYTTLIDFE